MTIEVELGWWLIPTVLTIAALAWTWREEDPLVGAFQLLASCFFSAMSWVVYLCITLWSIQQ